MHSKPNQIAIGIILFLIGLCLMMQNTGFNFSSVLFFLVGIAFILLFVTKRKSWALIIGIYLSWYAGSDLLSGIFSNRFAFNISYATFFIVTALIFFVLYYSKKKTGLLMPASILLWFGVYTILSETGIFHMQGILLMLCVSMAFFTAFFMGRGFIGKWALYTGALFVIISLMISFGFGSLLSGIKSVAAIALIIGSVVVILKAVKK